MTALQWDKVGERRYETGVDHGVLYLPNNSGAYTTGFAWNGLTAVTEAPSGAEANPQYADNIKYLNLVSAEQFGATIEAFTYPDEFAVCDGTAELSPGVTIGQQSRRLFGLAYRSLVGNDIVGTDFGYKLHLIYGALAAPSEKAYGTINDSPEALAFSWEVTTSPIEVGTVAGTVYKPTASLTIDSTKVDAEALSDLEAILYGTVGVDPRLPTPAEVYAIFAGTLSSVTPTQPTYNAGTDTLTIPGTAGVIYTVDGEDVAAGPLVITEDVFIQARPAAGYKFPSGIDTDWLQTFS